MNQYDDNNSTVNFIRKNLSQHPSHRTWFEELWNDSEAWSQTFNVELLQLSKHGNLCYSAYEMYIHALYRIYGQDLLDEKENKIDIDDVTQKLEDEGVEKFNKSYGSLLKAIDSKRKQSA